MIFHNMSNRTIIEGGAICLYKDSSFFHVVLKGVVVKLVTSQSLIVDMDCKGNQFETMSRRRILLNSNKELNMMQFRTKTVTVKDS